MATVDMDMADMDTENTAMARRAMAMEKQILQQKIDGCRLWSVFGTD